MPDLVLLPPADHDLKHDLKTVAATPESPKAETSPAAAETASPSIAAGADPADPLPTEPEQQQAAPARGPARRRIDLAQGWSLASIAAISFSLTFVAGGIALLAGIVPRSLAAIEPPVDLGVLMLMVPVCALVMAMLAEVLRAALSGLPRIQPPRLTPALSTWRPGRGEG